MRIACFPAAVLLASLAFSAAAAEELERRHEQNPLAVPEFLGKRGDAPERFQAYTETQLRYSLRYSHESSGETASAWLTSADVYAVFLPKQSWWDDVSDNPALLDHEQGHFDITEIIALEFQLEVARQLASGKALRVTAKDAAAATAALQAKFGEMQKEFERRLEREQASYDRATDYGARPSDQASERRKHLETLRALSRELAEIQTGQ